MIKTFELNLNGSRSKVEVDPETPLLYVLRNQLGLVGPKFGCGLGQCGACMVLLGGRAAPSCRIPVENIGDIEITTLEGLTGPDGQLHAVQQAFYDEQAAQCGYCTNGMIMATVSMLNENKKPSDDEIKQGLQVNICRCGVHARVVKAVKRAAKNG